jgi:hypothetical protein
MEVSLDAVGLVQSAGGIAYEFGNERLLNPTTYLARQSWLKKSRANSI